MLQLIILKRVDNIVYSRLRYSTMMNLRIILGITNYELFLIGCITYIQLTLLIFLSIYFFSDFLQKSQRPMLL